MPELNDDEISVSLVDNFEVLYCSSSGDEPAIGITLWLATGEVFSIGMGPKRAKSFIRDMIEAYKMCRGDDVESKN